MGAGATGNKTPRATPSPEARAVRRGSVPSKPAGNATSPAPPRSRNNGKPQEVAAHPEGLSAPFVVDAEPAARELSGPVKVGSSPPGIAHPEESNPTLARSRFALALCSVALLTFVVVASFVSLWQGVKIEDLTRILEILFAPLVAVVAAAVAFYYRGSSL
jgi:hypothetical protein